MTVLSLPHQRLATERFRQTRFKSVKAVQTRHLWRYSSVGKSARLITGRSLVRFQLSLQRCPPRLERKLPYFGGPFTIATHR